MTNIWLSYLSGVFQRMHRAGKYERNGIGLPIVERHSGLPGEG